MPSGLRAFLSGPGTLKNNLNRFAAAHTQRSMASFGHADVEHYLHALPVGANSANHHRVSLSTLFRYACKLGACTTNPVAGIEHRKFNTPTPRILTASATVSTAYGIG